MGIPWERRHLACRLHGLQNRRLVPQLQPGWLRSHLTMGAAAQRYECFLALLRADFPTPSCTTLARWRSRLRLPGFPLRLPHRPAPRLHRKVSNRFSAEGLPFTVTSNIPVPFLCLSRPVVFVRVTTRLICYLASIIFAPAILPNL